MKRNPLPFDNFNNLMRNNWSDTHRSLILLFPKLEKISEHLTFHIAALMEESGLLESDFHVLTAIRRSKESSPYELKPSEICQYMLVSWGGLNKIMNRLEKHNMICRIDSKQDKRIRIVRLTPLGEKFTEQAATRIQQLHQEYLTDFNQDEIQILDKLISKLLSNIEKQT
jgi:DNA-binding MarR family transcriptional regulator